MEQLPRQTITWIIKQISTHLKEFKSNKSFSLTIGSYQIIIQNEQQKDLWKIAQYLNIKELTGEELMGQNRNKKENYKTT